MSSVALSVVVFALLLALELEAVDYLGSGLSGLFLFVAIGVGVAMLVAAAFRRSRSVGATGFVLLAAAILSVVVGGRVKRAQIELSKARGDQICIALAIYRERTGRYPTGLDTLVPEYCMGLPRTEMGFVRSFPYGYVHRPSGGGFELSFAGSDFTVWKRRADSPWELHD